MKNCPQCIEPLFACWQAGLCAVPINAKPHPREVGAVLLRHPAGVEVSVAGLPDAESGEIVVACVVVRSGLRLQTDPLDTLCLDHIARLKRPQRYVYLDALPRNAAGKIFKTELRKLP